MKGKNCVAVASDTRYGIQAQTVAFDKPKVFPVTDRVMIGLPGLLTDAQTFYEKLRYNVNLYKLREERELKPKVVNDMVASMLYEHRFGPWFIEPIVCGLDENDNPWISGMDLIGAPVLADDFILAGTCDQSMFGMAEALWRPNLEPEALFETISQTLLTAFDRDATSGWGAVVHVITPDKVITRTLKARQD